MLGITKEQLAELPPASYQGRIITVNSARDARSALRYLSSLPRLGFDTETRPAFRKGLINKVALLQIATEDECFLFRLNQFGMIPEICALMENPDILKIGLSIKDDLQRLRQYGEFEPASVLELQSYVKQFEIADNSLQKVYGIIFGQRMSKGQRLTNWEAENLTEPQKAYAALDAYACLQIYDRLSSGAFNPAASPYVLADEANG